jgi:thymidylate synthase (FAD)
MNSTITLTPINFSIINTSETSEVNTSEVKKKIFMSDNIGYIELLDTFGDDLTVVNAARVSFSKHSDKMTDGDAKLVNYLAKHDHVSPFFHPQARFRLKMPIFIAREWFRHTVGFSRNEVSRRYVDTLPECWVPLANEIRERDPKLKQGSKSNAVADCDDVWNIMNESTKSSMDSYNSLLQRGVAPEIARSVLPQSMYTEFYETASLFGYARLCNLRLDPSAQKEIRDYASAVHTIMSEAFPVSWKALSASFAVDSS